MSNSTIDNLIRVLQDKSADFGIRNGAAIALAAHDVKRVLEALIQVAADWEEDKMLLSSCGESIVQIWLRNGTYNPCEFSRLAPSAKTSQNIIDYFIGILQNKAEDLGVRDDAAMDLGAYDEPRVFEALIQTAVEVEEHEMILNSCGESIMEIWGRKGSYSRAIFDRFAPAAKSACSVAGLPGSD